MTLFQARFVQFLTTVCNCSQRATAGNYFARYDYNHVQRYPPEVYEGFGGNQINGILLREDAIRVLIDHGAEPMFEPNGHILYDQEDFDNYRMIMRKYRRIKDGT